MGEILEAYLWEITTSLDHLIYIMFSKSVKKSWPDVLGQYHYFLNKSNSLIETLMSSIDKKKIRQILTLVPTSVPPQILLPMILFSTEISEAIYETLKET